MLEQASLTLSFNVANTASGEIKKKDWTKTGLIHTLTHTRGCENERKARAKSEELIEVVCFTAGSLLNAMSPLGHGEYHTNTGKEGGGGCSHVRNQYQPFL